MSLDLDLECLLTGDLGLEPSLIGDLEPFRLLLDLDLRRRSLDLDLVVLPRDRDFVLV